MIDDNLAAQSAVSSGLMGSPYGNNPLAAQGMSQADMQRMSLAQGGVFPGAVISASGSGSLLSRDLFRQAPRIHVEVDKVANGFVFKCGSEILIAKDLEELQGHFTAQVASMLLEGK